MRENKKYIIDQLRIACIKIKWLEATLKLKENTDGNEKL